MSTDVNSADGVNQEKWILKGWTANGDNPITWKSHNSAHLENGQIHPDNDTANNNA